MRKELLGCSTSTKVNGECRVYSINNCDGFSSTSEIGRASCRERVHIEGMVCRRRHTRSKRDWSSDVCSSDLAMPAESVRLQWKSTVFNTYTNRSVLHPVCK